MTDITDTPIPATMRQLRSLVTADGTLELSIALVPTPVPADHEVLVRVEAAPINPQRPRPAAGDGRPGRRPPRPAPPSSRWSPRRSRRRCCRARAPASASRCRWATRAAASWWPPAHRPTRRRCWASGSAMVGGATYAEYRNVRADDVHGAARRHRRRSRARRASSTRSPRWAWWRRCGWRATPRSCTPPPRRTSGQMLNRICLADGVPLVNIVRRPEQAALLREPGRRARVRLQPRRRSSTTSPRRSIATGATIAFDAIGGGTLAGQILTVHGGGRRTPRPPSTAATAATCTSRCTSTAASTAAPPSCTRNVRHGVGHRRLAAHARSSASSAWRA